MCNFACTGCRTLNDKDGTTRIPLRKANMTQKRWETNPKVPHSCVPLEYEEVAGMSLARKIKKKVAAGEVRLSGSQAAVRLSNTVASKFGNFPEDRQQKIRQSAIGNESILKQSIRRARIKRFPAKLKSLADLTEENYPDLFKTFRAENAAEDSPLHDEPGMIYNDNDMVLLSSPCQLAWLRQTPIIISDGSFRYAPRGTYQVYRIFGFVADHHCVPLVTVLLNGKRGELYNRMWREVAAAALPRQIDFALFDFEAASIQSFQHYFRAATPKMCAFHVCQAVNRRLQQLGLQAAYREGGDVRSIIRRLMAIITVPPAFMSEAVLLMHRSVDRIGLVAELKAKVRSLIDYFESLPAQPPLLGELFIIYRELSHHEEERAAAIERGDQQLRQGFAVYDDLKRRRFDLRTSFDHFLERGFTTEQFNSECYRYLGRMGNLLGIDPESRRNRREARSEELARQRAAAAAQRVLNGPVAVSGPEDSSSEDEEQSEDGGSGDES